VSRSEVKLEPSERAEHGTGVEHCAVVVGEVVAVWVLVVLDRRAVVLGDQRSVGVSDEPDPGLLAGRDDPPRLAGLRSSR
jgi:hypothetical protein